MKTTDREGNEITNLFLKADQIINHGSEEKLRDYGPIDKSMEDMATQASICSGKEFTANDAYAFMVALKMSRIGRRYKEDNYLDAIAYLGAWAQYRQKMDRLRQYDEPIGVAVSPTEIKLKKKRVGPQFGRVLSQTDVLAMKGAIKSGWTYKQIAKKFKISHSTVADVKMGRTWKHVK